jgi:hypothetical protein
MILVSYYVNFCLFMADLSRALYADLIAGPASFLAGFIGDQWCRSFHRRWWDFTRFYGGWNACQKCGRVWDA